MSPLIEVAVAMAGGAVGNAVGKSPMTGPKPVNKVLAPVLALLAGYGASWVSGVDLSPTEALDHGTAIGLSAIGLYSGVKNLWQLIKH